MSKINILNIEYGYDGENDVVYEVVETDRKSRDFTHKTKLKNYDYIVKEIEEGKVMVAR